jgi:hypothetical protein
MFWINKILTYYIFFSKIHFFVYVHACVVRVHTTHANNESCVLKIKSKIDAFVFSSKLNLCVIWAAHYYIYYLNYLIAQIFYVVRIQDFNKYKLVSLWWCALTCTTCVKKNDLINTVLCIFECKVHRVRNNNPLQNKTWFK